MEYRPLEITLISADGIKDVSTFGKMNVYAVAYISGDPHSKKKTKADKNCGTSPRWNQKLEFTVDERALSNPSTNLVIQLKDDRFGPDKDIGEVAVPLAELLNNGEQKGGGRQVDYQVRTSSGKPKGTVKFSYKFGEKKSYNYSSEKTLKAEEPVTAYPPPGYTNSGQAGGSHPGAVYPPGVVYQQPHPGYGYPPPPQGYYGGYPPAAPGGYPPQPGYGYAPPPPAMGYGYQQPVQQGKKKKSGALGMGLGLGAGLLGGMILGDMVSDVGEMAAYADGYDDAMDAASGFDF